MWDNHHLHTPLIIYFFMLNTYLCMAYVHVTYYFVFDNLYNMFTCRTRINLQWFKNWWSLKLFLKQMFSWPRLLKINSNTLIGWNFHHMTTSAEEKSCFCISTNLSIFLFCSAMRFVKSLLYTHLAVGHQILKLYSLTTSYKGMDPKASIILTQMLHTTEFPWNFREAVRLLSALARFTPTVGFVSDLLSVGPLKYIFAWSQLANVSCWQELQW